MNETDCQTAATCLGWCSGNEFREATTNESMYDEFPLGCFIHKVEQCVHFNPDRNKREADGVTVIKPANPIGKPICVVNNMTTFAEMPIVNDGVHGTHFTISAADGTTANMGNTHNEEGTDVMESELPDNLQHNHDAVPAP